MQADMAEKEATGQLEKHNLASEFGKQMLDEDKAEKKAGVKLFQDSVNALQSIDKDVVDRDYDQEYEHAYNDSAEDADDEIDSDDDYVEVVRPLNIQKAKTGKGSDQVHLATNHPEQTTQTTARTHGRVEAVDNLAQAQKIPPALECNLPRAPTPYSEASVHHISDLLHPSPPLRRRKGSMALRKKTSDSATVNSMISKTGETRDAPYGYDQDYTAENSQDSDAYLEPIHRGKTPKARGNHNTFSGDDEGNIADIGQISESSISSENYVLKRKTSGFPKADAVLGYGEEDKLTPKKSMTKLVTSPKASQEKKSFSKLFHRKGKGSTTPPSSGKIAGRMTISAPTLVDASPDAKVLLNSAPSLGDASPDAKNVVNYSRPIVPHSSSDVSNGSPIVHGRSSSALHALSSIPGPSTSQAADESGVIPETEKDPEASDSDSFNPSDYSGDENSVQQAVAIPIVYSGRAKLVDIRPPRVTKNAASGSRPGVGVTVAPGTMKSAGHDAEALGAQDADRYLANAMNSHTRPETTRTDDPFIDPAFRNLLAKPANEIAAKEMARLKAAREAGNMGGGLMERMNALLAKSDAKPGVDNTEHKIAGPRTNPSESLLSKMRALGKKSSKGKGQEDNEEEIVRKVEADKERGLREEKEIHARIKAQLAAKDAANGGVRGAGFPRIDYGPPTLRTALGGCGPTDEELAHARALAAHPAAGLTGGRVQNKEDDNTTARGQFEGY